MIETDREPHPYHRMEIYREAKVLVELVASLMLRALQVGQPAIVITRPETRAGVAELLEAKGHDVKALMRAGKLEMLDAQTVLDQIIVDGAPNGTQFRLIMGDLLDRLCGSRGFCMAVIYADVADLLVQSDNAGAALLLEAMWNRLAREYTFTLTCGYAASDLHGRVPTVAELEAVCKHHNIVRLLSN